MYPMFRKIARSKLKIVVDEQGHGRRKMHVTDTDVWTSTTYTMLLDSSAYLYVHVGPFDGFLEGLCHRNA